MTSNANYLYVTDFIEEPDRYYETLWHDLEWEQRPDAPRKEYWTNLFNRPYTYGRGRGERTYQPQPDHALIVEARHRIALATGHVLEGCFLNAYGTKRDWLGWHSDDDPGINHALPIAVITVGQGRNIQFRSVLEPPNEKNTKGLYGPVQTIMLESGSLILMHPGMQQTHQHRIPKADFEAKPRISLTFRGLIK